MLLRVSTISLLGPRTGDVGVKLEMGTCKVKEICRLIKLTSTSLLMRTWKGMTSSMVTIRIKGWPLGVGTESGWPVSTTTGGARCSPCVDGRWESA
jgi:hypothetical protein